MQPTSGRSTPSLSDVQDNFNDSDLRIVSSQLVYSGAELSMDVCEDVTLHASEVLSSVCVDQPPNAQFGGELCVSSDSAPEFPFEARRDHLLDARQLAADGPSSPSAAVSRPSCAPPRRGCDGHLCRCPPGEGVTGTSAGVPPARV